MHVHSLEFAAIGPFAGTHRIDFDGLGGASLFLIDGPTGAGKSTIIDALVFALFGDVAGRTSDRQRLRSAFAAADQETYAEVEFSTSFGRYRVRRTPEYERAKRKGTGTTTSASSVVLSRSIGEHGWEAVSTHKGEADAEIQRVIGLTRAQFLQTVVLPQGEFATFLSAESKDRQAVLERIFATDLYSRIEAALEARRLEAQREREGADRAVAAAVHHVVSRLSDADLGEAEVEVSDLRDAEEALAVVARIEKDAAERLLVQEATVQRASSALAVAKEALSDASARAEALAAVQTASSELSGARERADAADSRLESVAGVLAAVSAPDDDIVGAIDRFIGSLDHVAAVESGLPGQHARISAEQEGLAALTAAEAALLQERDVALPARLLGLSTALESAVAEADARVAEARSREARVIQARLDGMAGELAEALVDGQPCPVCGSREHPAPAHGDHPEATPQAVAEAHEQRTRVEAEHQAWLLEGARLAALGEVPADVDVPPVPTPLKDVAAGIKRFQSDAEALERRIADVREKRAAADAALAALVVSVTDDEAHVEAARAGYGSVADRLAELRSARALVVARDDARANVVAAAQLLANAEEQAARWAPDALPADVEALRQSCDALDRDVRAATSARDTTAGLVADLALRAESAREAVEQRNDVRLRTHDVITLANLMRGGEGNLLAQPLSAYVVQRMFDEIVEAANRRLQVMLDGRFSLKTTEQRTGPSRLGQGLGLEVVDQRTDSIRKTATLSGGETFCASLALALGLADTVRSHAGGIELGMLFIDEGFGSLDGDRLDEVMAELLRLRADGRTVGVISHVTEMKKGISERIDVVSIGPRQGSTLTVSWEV